MPILGLIAFLFSFAALAAPAEQSFYVDLGKPVYVRHKPAAGEAPTLVLLNGLTYSTVQWERFVHNLEKLSPQVGILRYDMKGMGKTLLKDSLPVNYSISLDDQVEILKKLLGKLKLKRPHLVGLSYGGGVALQFAAKYPKEIGSLVLLAPFTEALEEQDRWIRTQVAATRANFPWNPATDDELYDYFLRQFVYTTYPTAEPIVFENPFKLEAVYRMVQGIRRFEAKKIVSRLPAKSLHLLVANQDQYIPQEVMDRFWDLVPAKARASRINISYTEHKMPESIPAFVASWTLETIRNPDVNEGKVFIGNAPAFRATSGSLKIDLQKPF